MRFRSPLRLLETPARRLGLAALATVFMGLACAPTPALKPEGTFLEEFEGFPIYHGVPERDYLVLGPVYDASAAERGISPMKRAAVKRAKEMGADAIILKLDADTKWRAAAAIRWK